MLSRLVAAAVLVCGGALAGRIMASACARRCTALGEQLAALKALEHHMLAKRLPLAEALRASGYAPLIRAAQALEAGAEPACAYDEAMAQFSARGQMLDTLTREDLAPMRAFFASVGGSAMELVKIQLQEARVALLALLRQAEKKRDEQGKLYTSLGALMGLALAILLM